MVNGKGTYSTKIGVKDLSCTECPRGWSQSHPGSVLCQKCRSGLYLNQSKGIVCKGMCLIIQKMSFCSDLFVVIKTNHLDHAVILLLLLKTVKQDCIPMNMVNMVVLHVRLVLKQKARVKNNATVVRRANTKVKLVKVVTRAPRATIK